ncbi:PAS domain S-box protein [bacterium]|nr:PAS domain S-box protein [bacterium]
METRVRLRVLTVGVLLMWFISFAVSAVLLIPRVDVLVIASDPEQVRLIAALVSLTLFALSSATLLLVHGLTREQQRASRLERELQKGSAAFEKSRRTLDTLLGHAESTILIFGNEGEVAYVNPAHERILGYSPQEYRDDPELGDRIVFPEDWQKRTDYFGRVARLDVPSEPVTIRYYNRAGNLAYLDYTASPILSKANVTIGVLVIGRDTTREHEAEARTQHLGAVLRAIRSVNHLITKEKDRDQMLQGACDRLIETRGYRSVWIALLNESGRLVTHAEAGLGEAFKPMVELLQRGEIPACVQQALTQPAPVVVNDPSTTCAGCPLASSYEGQGGMTARLEHRGKVYGLLAASIPPEYADDEEEQDLFQEVAGDIAFALHSIKIEEERKRAEERLRLLSSVAEQAGDGMAVADMDGHIIFANRAWAEMHGYEHDELIGKHLSIFHNERQLKEEVEPFNEQVLLKGQHEGEVGHIRKDGSMFPTYMTTTILKDDDGEPVGLIGSARDITERKRVEEELRKLSSVVDQSPSMALVTDIEGNIEYVNPKFTETTGYTEQEVIGKNPRILKSGNQPLEFYVELWNAITSGREWRGEFLNKRKDGELYWERASISPIIGGEGEIAHFVKVSEDITEHKQLQEQFLQAQKMEAIGRLAGGVAHDFNNLLTVMLGYSEMLLHNLKDGRSRSHVEAISNAAEKAGRLTSQLLAFSRKQMREPRVLNINEVVTEMGKMLRRVIGEDIELVVVLGKDLNHVRIDPGQIEQVIMNLVVNARDAMPDGGKLVIETANVGLDAEYASAHLGVQPGEYVMLAVTDTGHGMDEATQKRVFEPFFTTKEVGAGTGLGLSTVYGIAKQNEGNVWVYSEPEMGATFKVYLPVIKGERATAPVKKMASEIPDGSETILLVEDEEVVRELAKQVLEQKSYKVLTARHGPDALIVSEQYDGTIHLLLTDVVMPEMNGKELAERLKALRSDLRVIYMSGYADAAIFQNGSVPESAAYLQKPFTPDSLLLKLREVLDEPE